MRPTNASILLPRLRRYETHLSILSFLAGFVLIFLWSTTVSSNRTYMSEHALQPGVVDEQFVDTNAVTNFLSDLRSFVTDRSHELNGFDLSSAVLRYIEERFSGLRNVDTQLHNFTIEYPKVYAAQPIPGQNLVAIARSKRTAHTEAVIIAVPFRLPQLVNQNSKPPQATKSEIEEDTLAAVALIYGLFKQLRSNSYWSRDLVFVLHASGPVGLEAFLDAYHDTHTSSWLRTAPLRVHGGAVQCAVALELTSLAPTKFIDLLLAGLHGRLPNLDLVNVAVRVGAKHGYTARIHGVSTPVQGNYQYDDDYDDQIASTLKLDAAIRRVSAIGAFVHAQAAASTLNGNHALFSRFAIESLTIKFARAPTPARGGNVQISTTPNSQAVLSAGRFVEALLRSVNNALERFHQSYFFYVMVGSDRFVSIGTYYPALACLTVPLLLRAIISFCELFLAARGSSESSAEPVEPTSEEKLLATYVDRRYTASLASRLITMLPIILAIALFSTVSYTSSSYFLYVASSFNIQQSDALTLGLAAVCFAALFYPRYFGNDFCILSIGSAASSHSSSSSGATTQSQSPRERELDAEAMQAEMLRSCADELARLRSDLSMLRQATASISDDDAKTKPVAKPKAKQTPDEQEEEQKPRIYRLSELDFVYDYRLVALLVSVTAALYLHCVALFNVSLALLIAVLYVPLLTFVAKPYNLAADTARRSAARDSFTARVSYALRSRAPFLLRTIVFALASPVSVIAVCSLFKYSGTSSTVGIGAKRFSKDFDQIYGDVCAYVLRLFVDDTFFGSWQLMLLTLCLLPIWLGGYTLIWMASKPCDAKTAQQAAPKPKTE